MVPPGSDTHILNRYLHKRCLARYHLLHVTGCWELNVIIPKRGKKRKKSPKKTGALIQRLVRRAPTDTSCIDEDCQAVPGTVVIKKTRLKGGRTKTRNYRDLRPACHRHRFSKQKGLFAKLAAYEGWTRVNGGKSSIGEA